MRPTKSRANLQTFLLALRQTSLLQAVYNRDSTDFLTGDGANGTSLHGDSTWAAAHAALAELVSQPFATLII